MTISNDQIKDARHMMSDYCENVSFVLTTDPLVNVKVALNQCQVDDMSKYTDNIITGLIA
ncbi:hypothetical protein DERF_014803 [Dermatophagoides farinae]|uniref:Uncharacterized protein n=1 Tax=Dermatophagoides farinae TaxID=6954 RepID=A0A922HJN7_DERFA|nr:hypothetical protein DERF_014803 [Dermatophagoides farinae]